MVASVVEDFWTTLDHIDDAHHGTLHNPFIVATYLGLRVNELAALQWGDVDLAFKQVHIRHNFDRRRRPSTVKSEESETWIQFGTEMSCGSSRRPRRARSRGYITPRMSSLPRATHADESGAAAVRSRLRPPSGVIPPAAPQATGALRPTGGWAGIGGTGRGWASLGPAMR
jgi:hypothetical protein